MLMLSDGLPSPKRGSKGNCVKAGGGRTTSNPRHPRDCPRNEIPEAGTRSLRLDRSAGQAGGIPPTCAPGHGRRARRNGRQCSASQLWGTGRTEARHLLKCGKGRRALFSTTPRDTGSRGLTETLLRSKCGAKRGVVLRPECRDTRSSEPAQTRIS